MSDPRLPMDDADLRELAERYGASDAEQKLDECDACGHILWLVEEVRAQRVALRAVARILTKEETPEAPRPAMLEIVRAVLPCGDSYPDGSHECDVVKLKAVIDELRQELESRREAQPTAAETFATATPMPDYSGWSGWYCHAGHPPGEALANASERARCWGCGIESRFGGAPKPT